MAGQYGSSAEQGQAGYQTQGQGQGQEHGYEWEQAREQERLEREQANGAGAGTDLPPPGYNMAAGMFGFYYLVSYTRMRLEGH